MMVSQPESGIVGLLSLADLARELEQLGEDAFRKTYPHPFLLLLHDPKSGAVRVEHGTVETLSTCLDDQKWNDLGTISAAVAMVKSSRNAYTSKITIGRAKNNDIIIRSPKMSKLHSTFASVEGGDTWQLVDVGSVNGTWVNRVRLEEKKPLLLEDGNKVAFWRYEFEFMNLDSFIALLCERS